MPKRSPPRKQARRPRHRLRTLAILLAIGVAIGTYVAVRRGGPVSTFLEGSGCQVRAGGTALTLDNEQAAIAATIAGVARKRGMPARAVTIAYATAMQESHMHNLRYGDLDSVGVFQQRPSEGWGPARKLEDPVYATTRFFRALTAVPHYQALPVYKAAQDVQHSADGSAYIQYQFMARTLTAVFTGRQAHGAWCWTSPPSARKPDLPAAARGLAGSFGPVSARLLDPPQAGRAMTVRAADPAAGWAMATWLMAHAGAYGIRDVRYAGYEWRASAGSDGWRRAHGAAPPGSVELS